ncbi:MAG: hypothetical protein HY075_14030 [Deltaproteobacteria bacterium]|nr:hypothetical protein [Deltaproteobacteria bacterium]
MARGGADWFIAALITGGALSAAVLVLALGLSLLTKAFRPEVYAVMNRRIGSILIFFTSAAIGTSFIMTLVAITEYVASLVKGAPASEVTEAPFAAVTLGLAAAPFLKRILNHWIRNWTILALVLTLSFTIGVLLIYPAGAN